MLRIDHAHVTGHALWLVGVSVLCIKMAECGEASASEKGGITCSDSVTKSDASSITLRRKLRKRKVKRLEKKLELYHRKIREAMEEEVSLDDMKSDTSAYLKEDVLKRKFISTWIELCDILKISHEIQLEDKEVGPYSSTEYPEINRRVDRLLKLGDFPDYWDIAQLIDRVNSKYSLGIKEKDQIILSRKVFKEVGERIKRTREKSWKQLFGCHLTDDIGEDPAIKEQTLNETLTKSLEDGRDKLSKLFEEYATRQEREEDNVTNSEEEEEEEEDEECKRNKKIKLDEDTDDINSDESPVPTCSGSPVANGSPLPTGSPVANGSPFISDDDDDSVILIDKEDDNTGVIVISD